MYFPVLHAEAHLLMSTRSRRPRNSTKTSESFPRLLPHSHDSPTPRLSRLCSPVLLYFTTSMHSSAPLRTFSVIAFSARSPVRRSASICHVVIFRRPPYVPAPPSLRLTHFIPHLLHIYVPEHSLHFIPYSCIHFTYKL